ncbi:organic cation transporter protein [Trichonephila clavata]|uniref:Organic cation transporter protein n=1 Tax=Trichonephila clavata TaxID=2740835 RepID=A0A8X6JE73_TRICU|nr:organic cation transporter protein [Trichonephila clavata]
MDFFSIVGSFGRWQLRVLLALMYLNVVGMWHNFSIIFMTPNMDFHCIQPPSEQHIANASAFAFENRCEVPQKENSSILVACTEWEYDTSDTSETIVSEVSCVSNYSKIEHISCLVGLSFAIGMACLARQVDLHGGFPTLSRHIGQFQTVSIISNLH